MVLSLDFNGWVLQNLVPLRDFLCLHEDGNRDTMIEVHLPVGRNNGDVATAVSLDPFKTKMKSR